MNSAREAARGGGNNNGPSGVDRSEAGEHNGGGGVHDRWPDDEDPLHTCSVSGRNAAGSDGDGTAGCGGRCQRDRRWSSVMWVAARICMMATRVCILALIPCEA